MQFLFAEIGLESQHSLIVSVAGFYFHNKVLIDLIDQINKELLVGQEFVQTFGFGKGFQVKDVPRYCTDAHELPPMVTKIYLLE